MHLLQKHHFSGTKAYLMIVNLLLSSISIKPYT